MGQVVIKAWGSMSPAEGGRVIEINHGIKSANEVWSAAHRALVELEAELNASHLTADPTPDPALEQAADPPPIDAGDHEAQEDSQS